MTKNNWLFNLRKCSKESTLSAIYEIKQNKLTTDDFQAFKLAFLHRMVEIKYRCLFDEVPVNLITDLLKKITINGDTEMEKNNKVSKFKSTQNVLSNVSLLKKFASQYSLEWLVIFQNNLNSVIDEIREEKEYEEMERAEKQEKVNFFLKQLTESGISPEELFSVNKKITKKPAHKYQYKDPDTGNVEIYAGRGRMKAGLKRLLDNGHQLSEFKITC